MSVSLPTIRTGPSRAWKDQKFLTLGQAKIGKSDFWSQGERTLFLEFEAGLNHLTCFRLPCRSWEEFTEVLGELYRAHQKGVFP
mgnify:FL=1